MDGIGIKKEIDRVGRIVIPNDIRRLFGLVDEVELVITEDGVLIRHPLYHLVKNCDTAENDEK